MAEENKNDIHSVTVTRKFLIKPIIINPKINKETGTYNIVYEYDSGYSPSVKKMKGEDKTFVFNFDNPSHKTYATYRLFQSMQILITRMSNDFVRLFGAWMLNAEDSFRSENNKALEEVSSLKSIHAVTTKNQLFTPSKAVMDKFAVLAGVPINDGSRGRPRPNGEKNQPYTMETILYQYGVKKYPGIPASIINSVSQRVVAKFKIDMKNKIYLTGSSFSTYNDKGISIPFPKSATHLIQFNDGSYGFRYFPNIKFNSTFYLGKEYFTCEDISVVFKIIPEQSHRGNSDVVLNRIISENYDLCDSSINFKDGQIFFNATYKQIVEPKYRDPNKIMGIDLGVKVPAVCSVLEKDSKIDNLWVFVDCLFVGDMTEQYRKRMAIKKQIKYKQKSFKTAKGGHGRDRKLSTKDEQNEYLANWQKTKNNQFSRVIVDFAIKNNVSLIKMEDLSGISTYKASEEGDTPTDKKKNKFLSNWTFYQLASMIEQKASKEGIGFEKVPARNTSKMCSSCGHIDKENRPTQSKFECTKCGMTMNADKNASINIAKKVLDKKEKE